MMAQASRFRLTLITLVFAAVAGMLSGCLAEVNTTSAGFILPVDFQWHAPASKTAASLENITGVFGFPSEINPLTGLPIDNPALLERRPIMIKVSNFPPSVRPQSGLSFADIVFEYYIGEGTNRFLALYYGKDAEQVGSLRSGRLVDAQLASMYQSFLVYGSADWRVDEVLKSDLGEKAISNLEAPCPVVCGGDTHRAPWVYVNTAEVSQFIRQEEYENERPNLDGMLFDPQPPESSQFGVQLGVEFMACNRGEWRYDTETGQYLRWIEAWDDSRECKQYPMEPLTDYINKDQLAFSNIVVLFADYYEYNPTLHDIYISDSIGSQRAVIFRDGLVYDGSWRALSQEQPIQFYNQYGLPMAFKPGKTWIVIAGNHSEFSETTQGFWEAQFGRP